MHKLWLGLAIALVLAACGPREQAPATASEGERAITDPAAVVRAIYDPYLDPQGQAPGLLESAPWSNRMRGELEAMMARSQALGEPILDFDPLINAQDWQLSDVSTSADGVVEGSHAVVRASFMNAGAGQEVVYDLIWEDDRWKVDNVRAQDWDLRAIITPTAPAATTPAP